jgi:hypothetical protein
MSSDAQTETTENRGAPTDAATGADESGRHRGGAASDDIAGRREPGGHGRHRRAETVRDADEY